MIRAIFFWSALFFAFGNGQYPPVGPTNYPYTWPYYNTQGQNPYAYYTPQPIFYYPQQPYTNPPDSLNGIQSTVQIQPYSNTLNPNFEIGDPTIYNDNEWSESFISKPEIQRNYLPNTEEYFVRIAGNDTSLSSDYNYAKVDLSQCNTILTPVTEFIGCAYGQFGASSPLTCAR